jgi:hypothetical protein
MAPGATRSYPGEMAELTTTKNLPNELRRRLGRRFAQARCSTGSEKAFRLADELTEAINAAIGQQTWREWSPQGSAELERCTLPLRFSGYHK